MRECSTCRTCFPDEVSQCPEDGAATTHSISGEPILDGRYHLEKRLGQGGMGIVFKGRHIFLKTLHAIKVILPDLVGNDPNLATRFRQEALAAAAIRHQNIIAVTDFGVVGGRMPFLVMEFVQGKSLQEIMAEEGAMPPLRAFELIQPICAGIAAAHRQNIVHRDLKPLNVMIQDGVLVSEGTKILDFGLAKIKSGELLGSFIQAQTTGLMGSPFYMAPEQWSDEPPDARADIYSLGIMFYQMLCGEVPFKGSSIPSIMKKHLTQEVPSLASKGVTVPPQIEGVIRHALAKEPANRTPSTESFLSELGAAMAAASASLRRTGETAELDPLKTLVTPPVAQPTFQMKGSATAVDPLAGTISASSLAEEQQKTLVAKQELLREAEASRMLAAEEAQRRKAEAEASEAEAKRRLAEEEEQKRKAEEQAREAERKHLEELVAKQTRALEEKLTQLASTMAPQGVTTMNPATTQALPTGISTVGEASFPAIPPKRSRLPMVLGLLAVLAIGGSVGGVFVYRSMHPNSGPTRPVTLAEVPIRPDLIEIPGGKFQMGRNDSLPTEAPAHQVAVGGFSMDKTEVTNAEYGQFVRGANYTPPEQWGSVKPPLGQELLPVSNVSHEDAVAFAAWRSKRDGVTYRLPTEEEWEYVARNGDKENLYPWGNTWQPGRAATQEAGVGKEQPVGTYPQGANRWGVQDLIGNVWEWTSSRASLYPGSSLKLPEGQKDWIVARGGSYGSQANKLSGAMRDWFAPNYKNPVLGFRLVKSGS